MRPSWVPYFFEIAYVVAKRATCDRAHVGCVLVSKDNHILATGYNGSVPHAPHCDETGHLMVEGHCVRTNHAEVNAVAQAAKTGTALVECTAYITHQPCFNCARLLLSTGVQEIIFAESYGRVDYGPLRPMYGNKPQPIFIGPLPSFSKA